MKKHKSLYTSLVVLLILILGLILFFLINPYKAQSKFFDKENGAKFTIPADMVKDVDPQQDEGNCYGFTSAPYYDNDANALINKSKEIVTLRLKTASQYCIKMGVYVSKNEVPESVCAKSYPNDTYYDSNPLVMQKTLIDQKPFIYVNGTEGTAGTAYGITAYRGLVNKKCVLIDVYYSETDPYAYADSEAESTKISNQFDQDYSRVNNLAKSIKFE